ncbi:MAG TPA: response regulator [Thermodesulfovibrionales bacterium]|nr:response regulator [Thermodesulfovibrionales bacterium]
MEETRYCLCCGENVPFNSVERFEKRELTCVYCGFVLDVQKLWGSSGVGKGYTLIAEDAQYIRKIISEALEARRFSAQVMTFENGLELVSEYSKLFSQDASINVVIIDLNMPVMDGITTARTIRAMEAQHGKAPAPIVFFSSMKADDALRAQMDLLKPASYMNKGSDPDPERLVERVEQLVGYLVEKYKKGS